MTKRAHEKRPSAFPAIAGAVLIFVIVCVAYSPVFRAGFIWDDDTMVTNNALVTSSDGLPKIWTSTKQYDYFPVTFTLFSCQWRLWGAQPLGYHVVNLLLHALGSVLLWRILLRLKVPAAWFAAALFAVHPVCVASVAWIAEQKNTLSFVFFALSALWFLRFEDEAANGKAARKFYGFSLFAFLLALLSKSSVVMLPLALLLCAWWRRGQVSRKDLLRTAPFFVLALICGVVTVWFQTSRAIHGSGPGDPFAVRLLGGLRGLWFYLFKALLPVQLSAIYPRWKISAGSLIAYVPGLLWLSGLVVLWVKRKSWARPWLFALGYFSIALLPVLGFFNMSFLMHSQVADQWQYSAILGIVAFAVGGTAHAAKKYGWRDFSKWAGAILVCVLAVATFNRTKVYLTHETLWADTLKKNPNAWAAHLNYASILGMRGDIAGAEQHLKTTLSLNPRSSEAMQNMANVFAQRGDIQNAIAWYDKALALNPNDAFTRAAAMQMCVRLAESSSRQKNWNDALMYYQVARKYDENSPVLLHQVAITFDAMGKHRDAWVYYRAALGNKPDFAEAHYNFALNLEDVDDLTGAAREYQEAEKLGFKTEFFDFNYANVLEKIGSLDDAAARLRKVLQTKPDYDEAHYKLGLVLERLGKSKEAFEQYRKVIQLSPNDSRAFAHLAWLAATARDESVRNGEEAVHLATQAVKLTDSKDATALDALAAAYAELGRFGEAVELAKMAAHAAMASNQTTLAPQIESRVALYRNKTPFRQP